MDINLNKRFPTHELAIEYLYSRFNNLKISLYETSPTGKHRFFSVIDDNNKKLWFHTFFRKFYGNSIYHNILKS